MRSLLFTASIMTALWAGLPAPASVSARDSHSDVYPYNASHAYEQAHSRHFRHPVHPHSHRHGHGLHHYDGHYSYRSWVPFSRALRHSPRHSYLHHHRYHHGDHHYRPYGKYH